MKGIVADADILGQFRVLLRRLRSPTWGEIWDSLSIAVETFATLDLVASAPDVEVWRCCQSRELVLITGNRNADGPESLEVTIRNENTPTSLPVLTISRPGQIDNSDDYAERVVETLLERLLRIDQLRGTGRLYLP